MVVQRGYKEDIWRTYGGRRLISVEECCARELRSIYFYLANSEEELLKVMAMLEKLGKNKTESRNTTATQ